MPRQKPRTKRKVRAFTLLPDLIKEIDRRAAEDNISASAFVSQVMTRELRKHPPQ
mgnify:CR=1 FL=1|jgi:hypothetical protein